MGYRLGDTWDTRYQELQDILTEMSRAATAGDVERFNSMFRRLTAFVAQYGAGESTGVDWGKLAGPLPEVKKAVHNALQAAVLLTSGALEAVQKSGDVDAFIEAGEQADALCAQTLCATLVELQKSGLDNAQAADLAGKALGAGVVDANARHATYKSAEFYRWLYGQNA
jgi:hypothetical protein